MALNKINYLSSINLNGLELQNASLHPLSAEPAVGPAGAVYYHTGTNLLKVSTGAAWISVSGDITDVLAGTGIAVTGTTEKTVSLSHLGLESLTDPNADRIMFWDDGVGATGWLTASTGLLLSGTTLTVDSVPNSALDNSSLTVGSGDGLINGGSVSLGGSITLDVVGGTGITANANDIEVTGASGLSDGELPYWDGTGLATSLVTQASGTVTIGGNLTVTGTTTSVNSTVVEIADSIITLNSGETGTPSSNGGLEIERGTSDNVFMQFKEASDRWEFTNDGTTYYNIPIPSQYDVHPENGYEATTATLGNWEVISSITVDHQGHIESGGISIAEVQTVSAASTVEGLVELATITEVKTGTDTTRAVTPAGLAALSYATNIGDGTAKTFTVTHNLGTRDVIVQVYDNVTYDTVYTETTRTSTSVVTIDVALATAPTTNKYRVVVSRA